jgi:hypothetical protein
MRLLAAEGGEAVDADLEAARCTPASVSAISAAMSRSMSPTKRRVMW